MNSDFKDVLDRQLKQNPALLVQWIAANARDAQREDRLAALFNTAGCKPRCYIGDGRAHGYIQMPRGELARAVYKAARRTGSGVTDAARLWYRARFS